jgi:multidrug efflux pump subunit AcrA (membrane-fusion protein)
LRIAGAAGPESQAISGTVSGNVLFRIADHQLVWVLLDVAERDLAQVAVGTKVTIRPRGLGGRTFTGEVALIYPHLMAQTRTARIRVELPNPDPSARTQNCQRTSDSRFEGSCQSSSLD